MPTIREMYEEKENMLLSPMGLKVTDTKGRLVPEEKCPLRTEFCRDRDRIIHSKSFRRLKHKTQVFISIHSDHFRTRLTHTLEVSQIARTISRALGLNEDLTEAIAMGHDLGHTPFGHSGERALDTLNPLGFKHNEQSLRVCDVLEKDGDGMNLTHEVRDGILNHSGNGMAETHEGMVIKFADRFAYINHDIDDAVRVGVISRIDLPLNSVNLFGATNTDRITSMIEDMVANSKIAGKICMSPEKEKAMLELREFMFDAVYRDNAVKDDQTFMVIEKLYRYFRSHLDKLPEEYGRLLEDWNHDTVVCDYISGMTDNYCVNLFNELFMPIKTTV